MTIDACETVDLNSPEEMDKYWTRPYRCQQNDLVGAGWDHPAIYPVIFDEIVRQVPVNSKVLDLGCGVGRLLYRLMVQRECTVKGVDHSQVAVNIAKEHGVDAVCDDILEYAGRGEIYDVVMSTEVIEHLDQPEALLEKMYLLVKPGGLVIISTPHDCLGPDTEPRHKHKFTEKELATLVGKYWKPISVFVDSEHKRMVAFGGKGANKEEYRDQITLAMILKDEAPTIRKTIESCLPVVDEIVALIDDKSTDATESIVKEYTDKVYKYTWENDFSKARNQWWQYCTKDWILHLDGHEYLDENSYSFLQNLDQVQEYISTVRGKLYMDRTKGGDPLHWFYHPRLMRNYWGVYYESPVHNYLVAPYGHMGIAANFEMHHYRTVQQGVRRSKQRKEMNIPFFEDLIKSGADNARAHFYSAIQYLAPSTRDVEKAENHFREHLKICTIPQERGQSVLYLTQILFNKDERNECRDLLFQYLGDMYDRPEAYMLLGMLSYADKDLHKAIHWFNVAAHTQPLYNPYFISAAADTWMPFEKLAGAYEASGDLQSAVTCARKMLEYTKDENLKQKIQETERFLQERRGNGRGKQGRDVCSKDTDTEG